MKKANTTLTLTNNTIKSPLYEIKPLVDAYDTINKFNMSSPLEEIQKTIKENNLTNQIKLQSLIPTTE